MNKHVKDVHGLDILHSCTWCFESLLNKTRNEAYEHRLACLKNRYKTESVACTSNMVTRSSAPKINHNHEVSLVLQTVEKTQQDIMSTLSEMRLLHMRNEILYERLLLAESASAVSKEKLAVAEANLQIALNPTASPINIPTTTTTTTPSDETVRQKDETISMLMDIIACSSKEETTTTTEPEPNSP